MQQHLLGIAEQRDASQSPMFRFLTTTMQQEWTNVSQIGTPWLLIHRAHIECLQILRLIDGIYPNNWQRGE